MLTLKIWKRGKNSGIGDEIYQFNNNFKKIIYTNS